MHRHDTITTLARFLALVARGNAPRDESRLVGQSRFAQVAPPRCVFVLGRGVRRAYRPAPAGLAIPPHFVRLANRVAMPRTSLAGRDAPICVCNFPMIPRDG